jgi:predicted Zn-dependent protease
MQRPIHYLLIASALIAVPSGCASVWPPKPAVDDVAQDSKRRQAEAIQSFESKRDLAQFEAAKVRWREGDMRACKDLVNRLLERNPSHRGGRLLRAELELCEGRPNDVLADIEALVQQDANDAEALYLLGLLQEKYAGQSKD